jgi:hypothetical protein
VGTPLGYVLGTVVGTSPTFSDEYVSSANSEAVASSNTDSTSSSSKFLASLMRRLWN